MSTRSTLSGSCVPRLLLDGAAGACVIVPCNSSSGCASRRSVTRWPTATLPASDFVDLALGHHLRQVGDLDDALACASSVSPTFFFSPRQFVT